MKKILFLINSLDGGGAERVLVELVNNMDCTKYEVVVQTIQQGGKFEKLLRSGVCRKSIARTGSLRINKIISYFVQFILPPQMVYRIFVKDNYDVEIAFLEGFPVKVLAKSNQRNVRKYTWVHIDLYNYYKHQKMFKTIKRNAEAYEKFDKIFCVSSDVKSAFVKRFGICDNVYVQYNVVNDRAIKKMANEIPEDLHKRGMDEIKLVSVGRLNPQKGFDRLIRSVADLIRDGYSLYLEIIGEGPLKGELQNLIEELQLTSRIKLLGFRQNPYPYMKDSDLFVCSSLAEGFSTVATEATILGVPIISTRVAGMNDLLGDSEYGLIVENDEGSLKNGIKKVLDDNLIGYYKVLAEKRAHEFTLEKRIQEMNRLFDGQ